MEIELGMTQGSYFEIYSKFFNFTNFNLKNRFIIVYRESKEESNDRCSYQNFRKLFEFLEDIFISL